MSETVWIGVDGGGSGCKVAALGSDGRRVETVGGASNATTDFDGAVMHVRNTIEAALASFESGTRILGHAGIAGLLSQNERGRFEDALPWNLSVTDDRLTTLTGALEEGDGLVAAIGTGSFVGCASGGKHRFIGGHGLVLGDDASAAWLGKQLFRETLRAAEGLRAETGVTARLLEDFGGDPWALSRLATDATPQTFGRYAPRVTQGAETGDEVATYLMQKGADYLAAAFSSLDPDNNLDIAFAGGGLAKHYLTFLPDAIRHRVVAARGNALDGALTLARRRR